MAVRALEQHGVGHERVECRRAHTLIPVGWEMIGAEGVD